MADPYLRNIYNYFTNRTGTQDPLSTLNTSDQDDGSFYSRMVANQGDGFEYLGSGDQGPQFGIRQGGFMDTLNQRHQGAANFDPNTRQIQWDFSKLPTTRFGSVENTIRVDPQMRDKLRNPYQVYEDPVYGLITHKGNYNSGNQWMGQLLMTLAGAGMGSVAGAGSGLRMAQGGLRGLQGAFKGNPFALASAFLPMAGVTNPMARAFLAQVMQRSRRRGKR